MSFSLKSFTPPDFSVLALANAPDARLTEVAQAHVAPEQYHAMSIFPEYFKVNGEWILAEESRMDCVPVLENGRVFVREPRHLKPGDRVFCGRTEDGSEGIYVYPNGFAEGDRLSETFAFRQGRSRETAFSKDYDHIYELLEYEKDHGFVVWVLGPAFSFDEIT